jgi:hypothetical protein
MFKIVDNNVKLPVIAFEQKQAVCQTVCSNFKKDVPVYQTQSFHRFVLIQDEHNNQCYLDINTTPTAKSKRVKDFAGESHRECYYAFEMYTGKVGYYYTGDVPNGVYEGLPEQHPDFDFYCDFSPTRA